MPKKTVKSKAKHPHALRLTVIILGSFLLLLGSSVYFQLIPKPQICANSISCVNNLSGKREANNNGVYMGRAVTAPNLPDVPELPTTSAVLGESTEDNKHIYVDLTNQKLFAYEGSTRVYQFPISSGKWYPTPTGNFRIHVWIRYTRMTGGSGAGYYDLPNVPYTMFFGNSELSWGRGFAIHGAYWHDNFGEPMSHGCINMRTEDVAKIYEWSKPTAGNYVFETKEKPGTLITIYGTAPTN